MHFTRRAIIPMMMTVGVIFISSCSKNGIACSDQVDCTTITYTATIKPLVEEKCALSGCHTSFSNYSSLKSIADNGSLYNQVVSSTKMPDGNISMSCAERAEIECWINSGAPNN